jgi:hypothetical protein
MGGAAAVQASVGRRIGGGGGHTAAQARGRRGVVGVGKHLAVVYWITKHFFCNRTKPL